MKKNKGFTLIELVVVIVILGILAVTAAPKFLNLQGDARHAALEGLKGAIEGAMGISYGKAAVDGVESSPLSSISSASGKNISIVFGYPQASKDGIINTLSGVSNTDDFTYAIHHQRKPQMFNDSLSDQQIAENVKQFRKALKNAIKSPPKPPLRYGGTDNIIVKTIMRKRPAHGTNAGLLCAFENKEGQIVADSNIETDAVQAAQLKDACEDLTKEIPAIKQEIENDKHNHNDDTNIGDGVIFTFAQYNDVKNDPTKIPNGCYLMYVAAQNAQTPAKVILSPDACLKK